MDAPELAATSPTRVPSDVRALKPDYEPFVHGYAERIPLAAPLWFLLFMLLLLGFALYMMAQPFVAGSQWATLHDHGVPAQATVTRFTRETHSTGRSGTITNYYVYYEYTAPNPLGTPQAYDERTLWPSGYGPARGSAFPVLYLPADPTQSMYAQQRAPSLLGGLVSFVLGGLFAGIAGFMLVSVGGSWLRLRWLANTGQLLVGTVAAVGAGTQSKRWYSAPITVEFDSPATGRRMQTTRTVSFASAREVPGAGARVAVLYRSDRQYAVL